MNNAQLLPHEAERNPIVQTRDGKAFADSRDVAAFFGKEHSNVLRDIRNLIVKEPKLGLCNFEAIKINDLKGESTGYYLMDRDGFTLLAMGFTGTQALRFKLRFIEAFNIMEAELRDRARSGSMIDVNDPAQLRGLLLSYADKAQALQAKVDELVPTKEAFDRIAEAHGSLCVTDAAKALQVRPMDLFSYLRKDHWIYRRPGTSHDVGYQSKVAQGLLEHKVTTVSRPDGTEKITEQVRVTPKGLTRLAELLSHVKH